MSNFSNRIQQGCQKTGASQSQDSQDERLDRGALKQKVQDRKQTLKTFPTLRKPSHSSQSAHFQTRADLCVLCFTNTCGANLCDHMPECI